MTSSKVATGAGVTVVERTENSKLTRDRFRRPVAATYVAQGSCPTGCAFGSWNGGGCYAELGPTGRLTRRLGAELGGSIDPLAGIASGLSPSDAVAFELATREAAGIDALPGVAWVGGSWVAVPLRLHVVGDCRTDLAAGIVAGACNRYRARGGGLCWGYTHAWREVSRASWVGERAMGPGGTFGYSREEWSGAPGALSVLASCESDADVSAAIGRGYAVALVRDHAAVAAWGIGGEFSGLRSIPCPQQTGQLVDCASCMACARDGRLLGDRWKGTAGSVIVLAPHGPGRGGGPTKAMQGYLDRVGGSGDAPGLGEL